MLLACPACSEDAGVRSSGSSDCGPIERCDSLTDCEARCRCQKGSADACAQACAIVATNGTSEFAARVLELTNAHRLEGGCCEDACFPAGSPLEFNVLLSRSAQQHADDMASARYLSHDSISGASAFDRMAEAGFAGCAMAENVARGQSSAEAVVASWLASPGHCENIYWQKLRFLGVGYAKSEDEFGHYWVEDFGG
jgi:uncharacterized protein YkwD